MKKYKNCTTSYKISVIFRSPAQQSRCWPPQSTFFLINQIYPPYRMVRNTERCGFSFQQRLLCSLQVFTNTLSWSLWPTSPQLPSRHLFSFIHLIQGSVCHQHFHFEIETPTKTLQETWNEICGCFNQTINLVLKRRIVMTQQRAWTWVKVNCTGNSGLRLYLSSRTSNNSANWCSFQSVHGRASNYKQGWIFVAPCSMDTLWAPCSLDSLWAPCIIQWHPHKGMLW